MSISTSKLKDLLAKDHIIKVKQQMIREVRGVITTELLIFKQVLDEQDTSLRFLTDQICISAAEAEESIQGFIEKDKAYKQSFVELGLSFVKLGLSFVGAQEIIDVAENIQTIIDASLDKGIENIQAKLDSIVENIGQNVVRSEEHAINMAEAALLQSSDAKSVKTAWLRYCDALHTEATTGINKVLETLKSNEFVWCTLLSCMEENPTAEPHEWVNIACDKAATYVKTIYKKLEARTLRINKVKDNALKSPGKITDYFIKKGLIDYTCAHKGKRGMQGWISSKLGKELSKHFPAVVFQRRLRLNCFGSRKNAIERRERMAAAQVKLNALPNSSKTKDKLFLELQEEGVTLYNALVNVLRTALPEESQGIADSDRPPSPPNTLSRGSRAGSYSFSETRRASLLGKSPTLERRDAIKSSYEMKFARRQALRTHSLSTAHEENLPTRSWLQCMSDSELPPLRRNSEERPTSAFEHRKSASFKRRSMFLPPPSSTDDESFMALRCLPKKT